MSCTKIFFLSIKVINYTLYSDDLRCQALMKLNYKTNIFLIFSVILYLKREPKKKIYPKSLQCCTIFGLITQISMATHQLFSRGLINIFFNHITNVFFAPGSSGTVFHLQRDSLADAFIGTFMIPETRLCNDTATAACTG